MNITRVALLGFPPEEDIDLILKNLVTIGVTDLIIVYFDDKEVEREIESYSKKLFMFSYDSLIATRKNLYGESIRLTIELLMRVETFKSCNVYFANQGANSDIIALFDNISHIMSQYFYEQNRLYRREKSPRYSITKCLWQKGQKYDYTFILYAKNMSILEQIGYVAGENEIISSGVIRRKIEDTLILEDEREKPSDSSITDHLRAIKKGFYGSDCYQDYAQKGFKIQKEIPQINITNDKEVSRDRKELV